MAFVFPGDAAKAASVPFSAVPAQPDPDYKTRTLSRRIKCHYSFMHENLMDMNHQFLHRSLMGSIKPALDLWLSYVPVDAEQRVNHSYGLMSVRKPSVPGLIHLFWPFIAWFTDGIFRQDQRIMEEEQKAWDAQKGDRNNELFPVINDLREVLMRNGVPPTV